MGAASGNLTHDDAAGTVCGLIGAASEAKALVILGGSQGFYHHRIRSLLRVLKERSQPKNKKNLKIIPLN